MASIDIRPLRIRSKWEAVVKYNDDEDRFEFGTINDDGSITLKFYITRECMGDTSQSVFKQLWLECIKEE